MQSFWPLLVVPLLPLYHIYWAHCIRKTADKYRQEYSLWVIVIGKHHPVFQSCSCIMY
jgi:hypothetical protein